MQTRVVPTAYSILENALTHASLQYLVYDDFVAPGQYRRRDTLKAG
jgi:hypothetical protein